MKEEASQTSLLAQAIRSVGTPDFIQDLLDLMRSAAPFHGAFVSRLYLNRAPGHIYDNVRQERRAVVIDRWLDRAWLLDPFVVRFIGDSHEPVMVLSDVAPDRFTSSDYYGIYYKSLKLKDEMAVFVLLPGGALFFSLGPVENKKRFTLRDVRNLTRLHPVIAALCEQHFHRRPRTEPLDADRQIDLKMVIEKVCDGLTKREVEVVQNLLRGHSSQSIALLLDVSPETVKAHRKNIYRKLGISSQSALFSMFLQFVTD
ncbi:LuxR C-terminal-related transcriptional regulator [Ruegeria sp. HKCCE4148]|uniref:helix-turn-helix transcriptional regulator n=1 Tax=unclassified Ruegeria TaxID=2625375 RepID=UPI0032AEE55F